MPIDIKALGAELASVVASQMKPLHKDIEELREQLGAMKAENTELRAQLESQPSIATIIEESVAKHIPPVQIVNEFDPAEVVKSFMASQEYEEIVKGIVLRERAPAIEPDIQSIAEKAAALIPVPKDADPIDIAEVAAEVMVSDDFRTMTGLELIKAVDKHFVSNPVTPGKDADPVTDGQIAKQVADYIKANPPAGGENGEKGADGIGAAGAMIDRDGCLLITMTNGEVKSLGVVVGRDGVDGISLESFDMEYLPETHEVSLKASCGDRTKEIRYPAGGIQPAGYWREGTKAKAGEVYTHDGSGYVAKTATTAKPESKSDDWMLLARKGRDGETVTKAPVSPSPVKLSTDK